MSVRVDENDGMDINPKYVCYNNAEIQNSHSHSQALPILNSLGINQQWSKYELNWIWFYIIVISSSQPYKVQLLQTSHKQQGN